MVFFNDNGQDAKGSIYQGGTHCPSILWRKGGFPCGHTSDARITNLDFAPTILDLVGAEPPQDFFDGRSFRPLLEGKTNRLHDALFFELGFTRGVLKENWKYIALRYPPNPETIVDLRKPEGGKGTKRPDPASPADLKPRPALRPHWRQQQRGSPQEELSGPTGTPTSFTILPPTRKNNATWPRIPRTPRSWRN